MPDAAAPITGASSLLRTMAAAGIEACFTNPGTSEMHLLMVHGGMDLQVPLRQSQVMDRALKDAGRRAELVVYPQLEHGLRDGTARADLLRRTDAFLRATLQP
jgi:acetyl esterase/lipase